MAASVRVDAQGRIVIPQAERERMGLRNGGLLELVSTPEGVLLEPRRKAVVTLGEDGLPLIGLTEGGEVTLEAAVAALHEQRDGA